MLYVDDDDAYAFNQHMILITLSSRVRSLMKGEDRVNRKQRRRKERRKKRKMKKKTKKEENGRRKGGNGKYNVLHECVMDAADADDRS